MPFLQVKFLTGAEHCDRLSEVLQEAGALAVTLEDPGGTPVLEPSVGGRPLWEQVRLVGLFERDFLPELLARQILLTAPGAVSDWRVEAVEDRHWEHAWMEHFRPMRFGERLWICPSNASPPHPEAVNLMLDPGLAFGTGAHPTTSLCLQWLDGMPLCGRRVMDYGCGSGVLAIAAAMLGADSCIAVDNDPQALLATRENAARNNVSDRLLVRPPFDGAPAKVDVVVANILSGILVALAPLLANALSPGGDIALSGILDGQVADVEAAYDPWCDVDIRKRSGGWVLLAGRRR